MLHIILVTVHPEIFHSFTERLSSDPEVCLEQVTAGPRRWVLCVPNVLIWLLLTPELRTPIPSIL